ncbi:bifunctional aspartate transaminase/aspartate 4-decarboxylase [Francisella tularensis]|uniref:bifunctional aspartate transaminase/aspartate 4-decarboxylase n=1 Tax=Francisella tularensis TaxID=263 RepID=UPI000A14AD87|nr:bifunctional aspartate transaminase/aspartate 4-decarboxylase [Francisella tularensis]MWZ25697.1 bifunctional aspartate transaminase/aspartate 4-decarboxylase [Francisella tularensis]NDU52716.1 bifunctional aspartate transaminase/aspartate 4-decarboxylase [Francisella tularensis subsp. holarctica]ORU82855.1 aspartate 4-decarboxylase [Francisella tularensis subsp. holarctica]
MSQQDLSPFEFKDELIKLATSKADRLMLNAGRGNPNFLATIPRHAFLRLGDFALRESERSYSYLNNVFGGLPEKKGITERFDYYYLAHDKQDGIDFLRAAISFVDDHLGINKEEFLYEMTNAYLGCNYPSPPRILPIIEKIVMHYLREELYQNTDTPLEFDIFATEGGTAAMTYIFQSAKINGLLNAHDKIAMITPIFSPYLEIPELPEYNNPIVHIYADEKVYWQVTDKELEKLLDPTIKILCLVNPSNPPSVKISDLVLEKIAYIIDNHRSDLMIITDDVYATFSDDFESLFSKCAYNTLCVYSFSKYFGATGWRIGTIALHKDNIFDKLISNLDDKKLDELDKHYSSLTTDSRTLKFIDRLVADSRSVALNHTAGISLPQQLQMGLFALSSLLDNQNIYRKEAKDLIRRRYNILYSSISPKLQQSLDENNVGYYTLLDLEELSYKIYDKDFSQWLIKNHSGPETLKILATETGIVLLPGKGFDVLHPSARVSLANLREYDYRQIGISIRQQLDNLYSQYKKQTKD